MGLIKAQVAKALPALAALLMTGVKANEFGNAASTGGVNSGNSIVAANATLILPNAPNPLENELSLWVGMGMSNGDLIQSLAVSYPGTNDGAACGDLGSNWCLVASTLISGNGYQSEGQSATAYPGDEVKMSYLYNDQTTNWDQFVYVNGDLVSTFQSSAGADALGYGTAEECQPGTPCGVVPQHQWIDAVIVLRDADPSYGSTLGLNGATTSISTPDGGYTWQFTTITIDQFDMTTGQ